MFKKKGFIKYKNEEINKRVVSVKEDVHNRVESMKNEIEHHFLKFKAYLSDIKLELDRYNLLFINY